MFSSKVLVSFAALIAAVSARSFCLHGVNYNPRIGADWAPTAERCKSATDIQTDTEVLAQVARTVRLYGLGDCDQGSVVVPAAINAGLRVSLGLWVSKDDAVFESEIARLQTLLHQSPALFRSGNIVDIHVGSEAIYRKDVTAGKNIEALYRVKKLLANYGAKAIPVTIADIGDVYLAHPELMVAVDFVQANAFPFWERVPVNGAVGYLESRMAPLYQQAATAGKKVVIGETGWASAGSDAKASVATPANAALYFSDFYKMAKQQKLEFFYFEAFDEEWKITSSNATVEGHFGLFHANRTLKNEIAALSLGVPCFAARNEKTPAVLSVDSSNTETSIAATNTNTATSNAATNADECHVRHQYQ